MMAATITKRATRSAKRVLSQPEDNERVRSSARKKKAAGQLYSCNDLKSIYNIMYTKFSHMLCYVMLICCVNLLHELELSLCR